MEKLIKPHENNSDSASHTFLTGAILFANLDYSGLTAYAVKAAIGGAIWMVFKLAGDFIAQRFLNNPKINKVDDAAEGKEDQN